MLIDIEIFNRMKLVTGTVVSAETNQKARIPAYCLQVDCGVHGIKQSSAQLTKNYSPEDIIGKQVIALINIAPRRVAGYKSEILVLAAVGSEGGTILISTDTQVENGLPIA